MKTYNDRGLILHRRKYNESDYLLTIFSKNNGKEILLAKGIRKITSRRAGHSSLFNFIEFTVHQGKTWGMITEVKEILSIEINNLNKIQLAMIYILSEVLTKVLPENVPHEKLLKNTYIQINHIYQEESDWANYVHYLLTLLTDLGYWSNDENIMFRQSNSTQQLNYLLNQIEEITEHKIKARQLLL